VAVKKNRFMNETFPPYCISGSSTLLVSGMNGMMALLRSEREKYISKDRKYETGGRKKESKEVTCVCVCVYKRMNVDIAQKLEWCMLCRSE
jgi:hypothetical protein